VDLGERKEMVLEGAGVVGVVALSLKNLQPKTFPDPLENWEVEAHLMPALEKDYKDNNCASANHMDPIPGPLNMEHSGSNMEHVDLRKKDWEGTEKMDSWGALKAQEMQKGPLL